MIKKVIEIEWQDDKGEWQCLAPQFTADVYVENDSIGDYEYWGNKEYDSRPDYYTIDNLEWNTKEFTEEENKIIEYWVEKNYADIEEQMTKNYSID